ncbi:MAG: PTS sugar transporter subunit IIA [Candidatus Cloacimonetes bacterium]|nr:PTS sugar transporter subunit IIA [Candidatus Cloacimonadota bacterium]
MKNVMLISDMLLPEYITDLISTTKEAALDELLNLITGSPLITDEKKFRKAIMDREKMMSTGIGLGVAVPHARDKSVKDFVIAVGRSLNGIDFDSIDDKPVQLIFMIGASDSQDKDYIRLLARLVLRLKNEDLKKNILEAANANEIYNVICSSR